MATNNLMIVDDERVIQELCSEILTRAGYSVLTADNGMEALKLLQKSQVDIVFVDLKMPIMGGLELLEIIKRDFPMPEVIIITAYATIENAVEAMKMGA
ncbi:response regulator [candidate division KSB1 bacterium]|nr:response regulator [candidate division KSB1 bacterium]